MDIPGLHRNVMGLFYKGYISLKTDSAPWFQFLFIGELKLPLNKEREYRINTLCEEVMSCGKWWCMW